MKISHLDHLVLTVQDIDTTCDFYSNILDMTIIEFAEGRKALSFGKQKFNLHKKGNEFEPKAKNPQTGSMDLCLISTTPIKIIITELKHHKIPIESGPIKRTGATGDIISVYFRDPDQNLIEVSNYVKNARPR